MLFAEQDAAFWTAIITVIATTTIVPVVGMVLQYRRDVAKAERDAALSAKVESVEQKVEVVHKATNSLVEQLVVAAGEKGELKGRADEKAGKP